MLVKRITRCLFRRDRCGQHGRERPTPAPEPAAPTQASLMTDRPDTRIRPGSVTYGQGFATLTFQEGYSVGGGAGRWGSGVAVREIAG